MDYSPNWQRKRLSARPLQIPWLKRYGLKLTICYSSVLARKYRPIDGGDGKRIKPEIDDVEPDAPLDNVVEGDQQESQRCGFQSDQRRCKNRADGHVLVHEEKLGVIFEQIFESRHGQQYAE